MLAALDDPAVECPRVRLSGPVALGVGSLSAPPRRGPSWPTCCRRQKATPLPKTFKDYEPGFVHVDVTYLPRMPDEAEHRYLIAAIDRASRWVYCEIRPDKTAATAAGFLERLPPKRRSSCRPSSPTTARSSPTASAPTGERDRPAGTPSIKSAPRSSSTRLIKPRHPQTNGMIERFNGRVAEVSKTTTFASARHLETTLQRYLHLYNQHIPQKNLGHVTPLAKLKEYYRTKPALFQKRPINHPGPDS